MSMAEKLLELGSLTAGYGSGDILRDVRLQIGRGEIVAVVGRNGVGKSTLMRTVIGLLPARTGDIDFKGVRVTGLPADARASLGMGYVPQGRQVFAELTVEENLMMGETINLDKATPRYDLVYEYFPILHERRRQAAGTFSGGQQQMLAIGRALVGDPALLLLDEPSIGIQPSIVQEIGETLVRLNRKEQLTILLVEQNMRLIKCMTQRGYAMDKGRIIAELGRHDFEHGDGLTQYLTV